MKKKIPYDVIYASLSSLFASYIFPSAPMSLPISPAQKWPGAKGLQTGVKENNRIEFKILLEINFEKI